MERRSVKIEIYRNGIKCKFKNDNELQEADKDRRGNVTIFSRKSMQRLAWVYSQGPWVSMLTLTYHTDFPDWKKSKKQLDLILHQMRYNNIKYLWVVEFQKRGFPHYHIWMDKFFEHGEWKKYSQLWLKLTKEYNGTEEAKKFHMNERCYTKWDVRFDLNYAVKYAQKQNQKWLPKGIENYGRWWGSSRNIIIPEREDISDFHFETEEDEFKSQELTRFRRNVKNYIFHATKRKKRNNFDRQTNSGFTYILNDSRKKDIDRLYDYALSNINDFNKKVKKL